jgi:hypothetical protein
VPAAGEYDVFINFVVTPSWRGIRINVSPSIAHLTWLSERRWG